MKAVVLEETPCIAAGSLPVHTHVTDIDLTNVLAATTTLVIGVEVSEIAG
jgi:hypothetical protein